jgi:hypothetical protein
MPSTLPTTVLGGLDHLEGRPVVAGLTAGRRSRRLDLIVSGGQ